MSGTQVLEQSQGQMQSQKADDHIVCMCNPEWGVCGLVVRGDFKDWDSNLGCPLCDVVYHSDAWRCPTCGCGNWEMCERCDE